MPFTWLKSYFVASALIIPTALAAQGFVRPNPPVKTLKGCWLFHGGIYNGKPDAAPKGYKMQRNYTDKDFVALASEAGYKTEKYETGNYVLKGDTCFETATFSSRPSQLVGKTVAYTFKLQRNELIFSGTLPSGMVVEEHWLKMTSLHSKK